MRERTAPNLPLPLKILQDRVDLEAPELGHVAVQKVSPCTVAVDWVPHTPRPPKTTMNPSVGQSPPMPKRMLPTMTNMQRFVRAMVQFWVMARQLPMVRMAWVAPQHRTPTQVLVTSLASMRRLMGSPFTRRGPHLRGRSGASPAPKRKHLPMNLKSRPPARKNSRLMRPCVTGASSRPSVWTPTSMPGGTRRSPKVFPAGPLEIP